MRVAAVVVLLVAATCMAAASASPPVACPSDCTSALNGVCLSSGVCDCKLGFDGPACENSYCPNDCGGSNGDCNAETKSCECNDGWTGRACADSTICPNDCGQFGVCQDDQCKCDDSHKGIACDKKRCPKDCSGKQFGTCDTTTGECACSDGRSGPDCSLFCTSNCSSNGVCVSQKCVCFAGFEGTDCSDMLCPNDCSGKGSCNPRAGTCKCQPGFKGKDCSKNGCNTKNYTGRVLACSGHGLCENSNDVTKMACKCGEGWTGVFCSIQSCKDSCNLKGFCNNGTCECKAGYAGESCQIDTCYSGCSGHGKCESHACVCDSGFSSDDCSIKTCANECGGILKGTCVDGQCQCAPGWTGSACAQRSCPDDCNKAGECNGTTGMCKCNPGKIGESCSVVGCHIADCNVHGQCIKGFCQCVDGYEGEYCDMVLCPSVNKTGPGKICSGHGACYQSNQFNRSDTSNVTGICNCTLGWTGPDCNTAVCPGECLNGGICNGNTQQCECTPGFAGIDCSDRGCKNKVGNVKGNCANDGACGADWKCTCGVNFGGDYCAQKLCPNRCNGKGKCDFATGKCKCSAGFAGDDCDTKVCVLAQKGCSGHGSCSKGVCNCSYGFGGFACQATNHCPDDCSGHGECQAPAKTGALGKCLCQSPWGGDESCGSLACPRGPDGVNNTKGLICGGVGECELNSTDDTQAACECNPGFGGDACEKKQCKNDCSGNGVCEDMGPVRGGVCKCNGEYGGRDCSGKKCPVNTRGWECSNHPNVTLKNKFRGRCNRTTGVCLCRLGLKGDSCDKIPSKAFCASTCEDRCSSECAPAGQQNDAMYSGCHAECNGLCMSDCLLGKQADSVDVPYNPDTNGTSIKDSPAEVAAKKSNDEALFALKSKKMTAEEAATLAKQKEQAGRPMTESEAYAVDPTVPTLASNNDADIAQVNHSAALKAKQASAQSAAQKAKPDELMQEDEDNKQIMTELSVDYSWVIKNEARFSEAFVKDMAKQSGLDAGAISVLAVKAGSTIVYTRINTAAIVQHQGDWSAEDWKKHFTTNLKPDAFESTSSLVGSKITGKALTPEPCKN